MSYPYGYKPGGTNVILPPEAADLARAVARAEERTVKATIIRALRWYAEERGHHLPAAS